MYTYEMRKAVEQAEATMRAADNVADEIAYLLKNRLQSGKVCGSTLRALKEELKGYNMHTGRWKS